MKRRTLLTFLGVTLTSLITTATVMTAPAQAAEVATLTFTVKFTSTGTTLTTLPGDVTFGWNHLVGTTPWGSRTADVDFLGSVDYVKGSGPFGGFVTITRSDGTTLAFSTTGRAMSPPTTGTEHTRFSGALTVVGGTKAYKSATGIGTMTGYRRAALGSPVTLTFVLHVRR